MLSGASFDDVARLLFSRGSRRTTLQHLTAAITAGWLHVQPSATAAPKGRCRGFGKTCSRRKKCCKGTKCVRGRCDCPRSKKRCGRKCIARTDCCPAIEELCEGECVTKGTCCPADAECCANHDCDGPCRTGVCQADWKCKLKVEGAACGTHDVNQCDAAGTCIPRPCDPEHPCPQPDHPCFDGVCEEGQCAVKERPEGTDLPDSGPPDCNRPICAPALPGGIGYTPDDDDIPPDPDPCTEAWCSGGVARYRPYPADHPCDPERDWVCDGAGTCGPPS